MKYDGKSNNFFSVDSRKSPTIILLQYVNELKAHVQRLNVIK